MDSEFLDNSMSKTDEKNERGWQDTCPPSLTPYTDIFNKNFPYYLSLGMTEEDYWDKDCLLVKYFREVEKINLERKNKYAWLQGMYIYDALLRVSPAFKEFSKKRQSPLPYPDNAYDLWEEDVSRNKEEQEKKKYDKAKRYMETYMVRYNQKLEDREGETCQQQSNR